jgi:hypothetical protein
MISTNPVFDIRIWEQIRSEVERETGTLLEKIRREISWDRSLRDYQNLYPVPWQMGEVMQQRAESWIQRLYDLCCDAYRCVGKEVSAEFDRAVWGYWIEPFVMREEQTAEGYRASKLFELLLCAVGSPPEKRRQLKVGQKDQCFTVRNEILSSWQKKLLRPAARLDEKTGWVPAGPSQPRTTPTAKEPMSQPPITASTVSQANGHVLTQSPAVSQSSAVGEPPLGLQSTVPVEAECSLSAPPVPAPRYPGAADWRNVEIVFLSDFRVQIRMNGKQSEPTNYAELGFDDGRSENPNRAWLALRSLAESGGLLREGSALGEPWPKVEKRIQEIRRRLRELFGISADPIPFVEGSGYRTMFKIRCGPSFRT